MHLLIVLIESCHKYKYNLCLTCFNSATELHHVWLLYSVADLRRSGIRRDQHGFPRLQQLRVCLWTNRLWENSHHDGSGSTYLFFFEFLNFIMYFLLIEFLIMLLFHSKGKLWAHPKNMRGKGTFPLRRLSHCTLVHFVTFFFFFSPGSVWWNEWSRRHLQGPSQVRGFFPCKCCSSTWVTCWLGSSHLYEFQAVIDHRWIICCLGIFH